MSQYAVFAVTHDPLNKRRSGVNSPTFRIGLPTTFKNAHKRHARLDHAHYNRDRKLGVFVGGRGKPYAVKHLEVRQVDTAGRGFGRPDHFNAVPVLAGAIRILPDAPHDVKTYVNRNWSATAKWGCTLTTGHGAVIGYGRDPIAATADARKLARRREVI